MNIIYRYNTFDFIWLEEFFIDGWGWRNGLLAPLVMVSAAADRPVVFSY
jgi:hypothetical protein